MGIQAFISSKGKKERGEQTGKWFELGSCCSVEDILDEVLGFEKDEDGEDTEDRLDEEYEIEEVTCDDGYDIDSDLIKIKDLDDLQDFAEFWDGLRDNETRAFMAYCEAGYSDLIANKDGFEAGNHSYYDCKDFAELGKEWYDGAYGLREIPTQLQYHIDWDSFGRDLGYTETEYGFINMD